ncbi:hypothetical protein AYK24_03345 [Thermoplasmatales archaeon SG8-52-4]|nr:MAG: hypothetical protein AYK24_03345 [Thermoplasmatales archaeon SG8-52-4]
MAFGITYVSIPPIIELARVKGLYDMPNGRTSHIHATPYLGGVAVFTGLILSTIVIASIGFIQDLSYVIAGLIIILFVGLKDDMLIINPNKKLAGQLIASGIIVVMGDIRIDHFHGVLGFEAIPYFASIMFTIFVFIVIINGLNLIDGIDGLASGVGILIAITFGIWFTMADIVSYSVMSFSLAGSLIAFFYFNVFSKKNKIFLGDAGSLIIGFTTAVITVQFLENQTYATDYAIVHSAPAVAFGILIVPLYDTLRVFILRISQGRSPFSADRQHIHHVLLDLGFSHLRATMILLSSNLFFIILSISLQKIGYMNLIILQLFLATVSSFLAVWLLKRKRNKVFSRKQPESKHVELFKSTPADVCFENDKKLSDKTKKMRFLKILNV